MESIAELEKIIYCLERENQYFKRLLADSGISYSGREDAEDNLMRIFEWRRIQKRIESVTDIICFVITPLDEPINSLYPMGVKEMRVYVIHTYGYYKLGEKVGNAFKDNGTLK